MLSSIQVKSQLHVHAIDFISKQLDSLCDSLRSFLLQTSEQAGAPHLWVKCKIYLSFLFSNVTSKGPPQLKSTRPCKTNDVIWVWVAGCDEHVRNLLHGLQWRFHRHLRPLLWHQPQEDWLCWGNAFYEGPTCFSHSFATSDYRTPVFNYEL